MNPIRIGKVWLNEGPLDGMPVIVKESQNIYEHITNGRTHTYSRVGTTNSFFYAGARPWVSYEVADDSAIAKVASINWLHKLRSLMG